MRNRPFKLLKPLPLVVVLAAAAGFVAGIATERQLSRGRSSAGDSDSAQGMVQPLGPATASVSTTSPASPEESSASGDKAAFGRALREAHEKRQRGEYVLDSDIGPLRERLEASAARGAKLRLDVYEKEYNELFSTLGVDPETAAQLEQHIETVFRAQNLASTSLTVLMNAKIAYDDRMRQVLGDNYDIYRTYEENQPAQKQMAAVRDYAARAGLDFPSSESDLVQGIIKEQQLYSTGMRQERGGPYADLAMPFGGSWYIPGLEARRNTLEQGLSRALQRAQESGLSPQSVQVLQSYYRSEVETINEQIELERQRAQELGSISGRRP